MAKIDPATGTPIWQTELAAPSYMDVSKIAVGPEGEIVVAGQKELATDTGTELRVWRFTSDGAPVWTRVIDSEGHERLTDLQFTPDGQLLALRGGPWPHPRVALMALAFADGATLWQHVVAEPTIANGGPWSEGFHIDDGEVRVPITRVRAPSLGDWGHDRSLEVHRLSLQGEPLGITAVAGPGSSNGPARTRSVIGRCGQLVLFAPDDLDVLWLTGLAP